jgi:hypothetical protein
MDRIMNTYAKLGRPDQVSLLIGPALGDLKSLTENYLPKSAIDRTTMKMGELLRRRFGPGEEGVAQFSDTTTPHGKMV